ncbi:MAG: hypothetical protein ABIH23_34555 [bacterium]
MTRNTSIALVVVCGAVLIAVWVSVPSQRTDREGDRQQAQFAGEDAVVSGPPGTEDPTLLTKAMESSPNLDSMPSSTDELASIPETQNPYLVSSLLRNKVLRITEKELVAKYNIKVTTDQIRDYVEEEVRLVVTPERFKELKRNAETQVAAAEAMFREHLTPEQAAEKYLKPMGGATAAVLLKYISSQAQIEEMRSMIPQSVEDMIEKSIPGHREIVERDALASIILSADEKRGGVGAVGEWSPIYEERVLDYARKNLLGSHPELLDVRAEDLDQRTMPDSLPPRN